MVLILEPIIAEVIKIRKMGSKFMTNKNSNFLSLTLNLN